MAERDTSDMPALQRVGAYELLELVGRGGMGAVYRARDAQGNIVALKLLAPKMVTNEIHLRRFYQEAEIAQKLSHPNIVRAIEVGEVQGQHYFVMEFIEGETLTQRIKKLKRIPQKEAARIILGLARALAKAHQQGLIHRDIKPDNVLITNDQQVKLADMGLAKVMDNDLNLTKTGKGLGTPHFMAPEQFRNAKHATIQCDIYSLGATLYLMLTGHMPFKGDSPVETYLKKSKNDFPPPETYLPNLHPSLRMAIIRSMDADPAQRPRSAEEFIALVRGEAPLANHANGKAEPATASGEATIWYCQFVDADGQKRRTKGKASVLINHVKKNSIPNHAEVSLQKEGPYQPMQDVDVFRAILANPTATAPPADPTPKKNDPQAKRPAVTIRNPGTRRPNSTNRPQLNPETPPIGMIWFLVGGVAIAGVLAVAWWFLVLPK